MNNSSLYNENDLGVLSVFNWVKCRKLTWDNMYGYLYASPKEPSTVNVIANKPLLIRASFLNRAWSGGAVAADGEHRIFSFMPEENEMYYVGVTFPNSDSFLIIVDRVDRESGERESIYTQQANVTGAGLRFSPQVASGWTNLQRSS